jgi:hypothetical protein
MEKVDVTMLNVDTPKLNMTKIFKMLLVRTLPAVRQAAPW